MILSASFDTARGSALEALVEVADASIVVVRACYLALRRAVRVPAVANATGVVLVEESGRALGARDIGDPGYESATGYGILSVAGALARQVVGVVQQLRQRDDLLKPPGVAETLDWARALTYLGSADLDLASAAMTLGALLKYREDADRVRAALDRMLAR